MFDTPDIILRKQERYKRVMVTFPRIIIAYLKK